MKKNFTLISALALAFAAQAAPGVSYKGEAIADGQTVKFNRNNLNDLAGVLFTFEEHFEITGATPVAIKATSNTDKLGFCVGINCQNFFADPLLPGIYTASGSATSSPDDLKVDAAFEGEANIPTSAVYIQFNLTDSDSDTFSFRVEFDPSSSSVVEIAAESENVTYDIAGRPVAGENLPAGLYIKNGKKVIVK